MKALYINFCISTKNSISSWFVRLVDWVPNELTTMYSDCSQCRALPIIPMSLILEFPIVGFVPLDALLEIGVGTLQLSRR